MTLLGSVHTEQTLNGTSASGGEIGHPGFVEMCVSWPRHRSCQKEEIFTCLDPKEMRNDEKISSLFAILFLSRYLVGSLNPSFYSISLSH